MRESVCIWASDPSSPVDTHVVMPRCAAASRLALQWVMAADDQMTPSLLKLSFSSHPQLIETTYGSLAESLITLLRPSIRPFSSNVEK
jgi:hypothetical protein